MTNSALSATPAATGPLLAGTPLTGTTLAGTPLDLVGARAVVCAAFVAQGQQRWGLEQEWVLRRDGDPRSRPALQELHAVMADPLPGMSRVTIEPGGQVELSTTPYERLDDALDALELDRQELAVRLGTRGLVMVDDALDLVRQPQRILTDARYRCMEEFFDHDGPAGRWMMCNTAGLQVNVSHDPADPADRWQLIHHLGPILLAVFACSPGKDRDGRQWASLRQGVWSAIDPSRTRPVPSRNSGPPDNPELAWLDYALNADTMLIRDADSAQAQPSGLSFGRWMAGDGVRRAPTPDDLRYHLTTLFPMIRPRGWLELRMIDALPTGVREVAALVVAAALRPRAATVLRASLPDTSGWWLDAARDGLAHDGLASAARILFSAVQPELSEVTSRPDRIAAVREYATSHVAARLQPWGGRAGDPAVRTDVDLRRLA